MNRKNLTAAVLAGLAGVAGIAGTAQAVNINPDGTGQVLLYPYYTTNGGNQTLISVVNTTEQAKAVKVRFLEGFNSREVLDFNLYMSREDVWVASVVNGEDFTGDSSLADTSWLLIPDTSCTVPYLYETKQITMPDGRKAGLQEFLNLAYAGKTTDPWYDGGPQGIARAAEGHIEMIEMGTLVNEPGYPVATAVTHKAGVPQDCDLLTELWTEVRGPGNVVDPSSGQWVKEAYACEDEKGNDGCATTGTMRNSGGLFGGGAVVNTNKGTMFSYNATAIQGFDASENGIHYRPGGIYPSLDSGDQHTAWVFFGVPQNQAVSRWYHHSIDAVSAVMMHDYVMNEYVAMAPVFSTEWILTFPTKNFYVDKYRMDQEDLPYPGHDTVTTNDDDARAPFTEFFGAMDEDDNLLCEVVNIKTWDREEATYIPGDPNSPVIPPTVSPSVPGDFDCEDFGTCPSYFQLCGEVNVLRFGEGSVFDTPEVEGWTLLHSVEDEFTEGWGKINMTTNARTGEMRQDEAGLVGLPISGFAAYELEATMLGDGSVLANYGGLFGHRYSVRAVRDERCSDIPNEHPDVDDDLYWEVCGPMYRPMY